MGAFPMKTTLICRKLKKALEETLHII